MIKCKVCNLNTYGHSSGLCVIHRKMKIEDFKPKAKEVVKPEPKEVKPLDKEIKAETKTTKKAAPKRAPRKKAAPKKSEE